MCPKNYMNTALKQSKSVDCGFGDSQCPGQHRVQVTMSQPPCLQRRLPAVALVTSQHLPHALSWPGHLTPVLSGPSLLLVLCSSTQGPPSSPPLQHSLPVENSPALAQFLLPLSEDSFLGVALASPGALPPLQNNSCLRES